MPNPPVIDRAVLIAIPGPQALVKEVAMASEAPANCCHGIICAEGSITGGTDFQEVRARIYPPGTTNIPNDPPAADSTQGTVYADKVHWRFYDGEGKGIPNAAAEVGSGPANNILVVWAKVDGNWQKDQINFRGIKATCTDCDPSSVKK